MPSPVLQSVSPTSRRREGVQLDILFPRLVSNVIRLLDYQKFLVLRPKPA